MEIYMGIVALEVISLVFLNMYHRFYLLLQGLLCAVIVGGVGYLTYLNEFKAPELFYSVHAAVLIPFIVIYNHLKKTYDYNLISGPPVIKEEAVESQEDEESESTETES
jgi:hypothetical protein